MAIFTKPYYTKLAAFYIQCRRNFPIFMHEKPKPGYTNVNGQSQYTGEPSIGDLPKKVERIDDYRE